MCRLSPILHLQCTAHESDARSAETAPFADGIDGDAESEPSLTHRDVPFVLLQGRRLLAGSECEPGHKNE